MHIERLLLLTLNIVESSMSKNEQRTGVLIPEAVN
jgi:hypothetical protein